MEKACYPTEKIMYLEDPQTGPIVYRVNSVTIPTVYTNAKAMVKSDGTMGTISIPSMNVSFKVRDGETTANMLCSLQYELWLGWKCLRMCPQ